MMSRHRQIKTITRALNESMSSLPLFYTKTKKQGCQQFLVDITLYLRTIVIRWIVWILRLYCQ